MADRTDGDGRLAGRPAFPMVILAGGQNSRLTVLSGTIYKPFLPINGMSFVARQVARAALAGIADVTVIVDTPDPLIGEYVRLLREDPRYVVDVSLLCVEGDQARKLTEYSRSTSSRLPVVVCNGDTYVHYDPIALAQAAQVEGVDSAILVAEYRLPFGVVSVVNGRAAGFDEKPNVGYKVSTGQLAVGPEAFRLMSDGMDLAATLSTLAFDGRLAVVEAGSSFVVIDSFDDVAAAHRSEILQ